MAGGADVASPHPRLPLPGLLVLAAALPVWTRILWCFCNSGGFLGFPASSEIPSVVSHCRGHVLSLPARNSGLVCLEMDMKVTGL